MRTLVLVLALVGLTLTLAPCQHLVAAETAAAAPAVKLLRVPDGGYQQQICVDAAGTVHMVYLKGDAKTADIFYVKLEAGKDAFSAPIRVNSQAGAATGTGTIRGPQMAVGKGGRVHVVWNGNSTTQPRGPLNPDMAKDSPYNGTPFMYTRLKDDGTEFEAQRNLLTYSFSVDGGGSVAADADGHVYAVWHACTPGGKGEDGRVVFVSASTDEGKTFAKEAPAAPNKWGACGCCSLKAFTDAKGNLFVLYRTAKAGTDRDMDLLISRDKAKTFQEVTLDKWSIGQCVMSSASIIPAGDQIELAWETKEQVLFSTFDPKTNRTGALTAAPGTAKMRKHPDLARNADGATLFAWTEGTGWQKGGNLAWQVYDKAGKPVAGEGASGNKDGVVVWGLVSAAVRPDGSFVLVY